MDDGTDPGTDNVPGYRVRRQTRDVASLLTVVHALYVGSGYNNQSGSHTHPTAAAPSNVYYMFMEDDFRLCPSGLEALAYLLAKAAATYPDWNAIRVSYGLNGGIIRMADVPALAAYYTQHVARRPPDHMLVEWFAGETAQSAATKRGRPHLAFRYNVLEHFGATSSLRGLTAPTYAVCYELLDARVVFDVEAFSVPSCGHSDITPCSGGGGAALPTTDIDFGALASNAREDSVQGREVVEPPPPPQT